MQVFVCSGSAEDLRKWDTLVPNSFYEFVNLRAEAENHPQKPAESLQTWLPGSRILTSQAHEVCAHVLVWGSICHFLLPPEPSLASATLWRMLRSEHSPWPQVLHKPCGTLGTWVQSPGVEGRGGGGGWSPATLLKDQWQLLLKSCSAAATALSWLCLPALTM